MALTRSRSLADLQALCDVRHKLTKFEEMRNMFVKQIDVCKTETGYLSEYLNEFNQLTREKLAHVEVLRQINCDMNQLESTIKQSRNDQLKAAEKAKCLFGELLPLRDEINLLRSTMNQELLPENIVAKDALSLLLQFEHQQRGSVPLWQPEPVNLTTTAVPPCSSTAPGISVSTASRSSQLDPLTHLNMPTSGYPCLFSPVLDLSVSGVFPKQQQPPPMKTCTSCQQQIHRNAPICPLCKSKSRSRNPKKAKARKANE
uniref:C4H2-type domain-containing protein n=1 Tax=Trichuris muris TaxID=70415 RepID=A0A5S6QD53_TRIMR